MMGMVEEELDTPDSEEAHQQWLQNQCQPNYFRGFQHAEESCPPYPPPRSTDGRAVNEMSAKRAEESSGPDSVAWRPNADPARLQISELNHDTIGLVVVQGNGDLACGTTTNGANNKIKGRVGDSPIAGAGCYVDNDVGGAAATGDGDVMMR